MGVVLVSASVAEVLCNVLSGDKLDQAQQLIAVCQIPTANPHAAIADISLEFLLRRLTTPQMPAFNWKLLRTVVGCSARTLERCRQHCFVQQGGGA